MCTSDIFLALLAILFPPIAVWIKSGLCTADSLINIALCCLGYFPGLIHAWYIIARHPDPSSEYEPIGRQDPEGGRVTYYYVAQGHQQQQPPSSSSRGYGTNRERMQAPNVPPKPQQQQQQQQTGVVAADEGQGSSNGQTRAPPTYAEAVKGDHKVQTQD